MSARMSGTALGARLAVAAAVLAAGCSGAGGSGSDEPGADPVSLVGETEQGLRLRIDVVDGREVSVRFPAMCSISGDPGTWRPVSLHRHRFETAVDDDGGFTVDEAYAEDTGDGDEEHVEVRIDGDFSDDGTASGTLEVLVRRWIGEEGDFGRDCVSGTVAWAADQPPVEGDNLVVPTGGPMAVAPTGPDLLARSEAGELLRLDAATGDARRLDGSAPAGPPTTSVPGVPPTVIVGGAADPAAAPLWLHPLEVVAGGVWAVDPASGAVTRFELADGSRTATIAAPLDDIAAGPDALWTVSTNAFRSGYTLDRRDPVTGAVIVSTPVDRGKIIVGPTGVWYAYATWTGGRFARVDPGSGALGEPIVVELPLFGDDPVHSGDRVWWLDDEGLMSLELAGGRVGPVDLPSEPSAVAADAGGVWTIHEQESVARRIEGDQVVRTVDIPDGWWSVAVSTDGAVWLSETVYDAQTIVRLDPAVTG